MSKKNDLEHTSTTLGSQNMKSSQRMVSVVEPYELPEGWKWCRLGEVADWGSGGTPSRKNPEYYQGSIPWIKTGELNETYIFDSEEKVSEDAIKHSSAKIFPKETVVMAMYGATIGKTAIFGIDASTNQACACAICHKELDNHFLFNFLKSKKDYFLYNAKGGAQPNISQEIIKNTLIPLPPTLAEQQRIVNRIESMFAKLDEAKEKAQNVLDGFETRKAAILHKAFTGELTAKWRKENGVSDDSWEEKTLGELLFPMTSKNPTGDTFRYIDIDAIDNENQVVRCPKTIVTSEAPSRASRELKENDVLFSMVRPYLKNIAFIDNSLSDCIASTGFYICRCKEVIFPFYLYNFLCSKDAIDYLMQFMKGDNSPSIRKDDLLGMKINLPTLPEQVEIVRILDIIIEKENKAKQAAEAVLEQIDLLKKSILARAFRGEL